METVSINTTMSSREIATMTGKQHTHVMRDIKTIQDNLASPNLDSLWISTTYIDNQGKVRPMYSLTKKGSLLLATKYNDNVRLKLIERWEELEKQSAKPNLEAITKKDLAIMLLESEQEKEQLLLENQRMKPRDEFFNKFFTSDGLMSVEQASKVLKLGYGRTTLYKKMRDNGIVCQNSTSPMQEYINRGYFTMKMVKGRKSNEMYPQTFVLPKGLAYLAKILNAVTVN